MKALVCNEFATIDKLNLEDKPVPKPSKGEVLIDVKAAGVNFPDLLTVQGKYKLNPHYLLSRYRSCGCCDRGGESVSRRKVGDKVIATTQIGGFAEQCVAPEFATIEMAKSMSFAQAAGFSITYGTSYYALKQRANLQAGETVLVLGAAGGVGIATIQIAKAMGARSLLLPVLEEKLDFATEAGADMRINCSNEPLKDKIKELTGGKGADVIYDPVGGDLSEQAFRGVAWDGRFSGYWLCLWAYTGNST